MFQETAVVRPLVKSTYKHLSEALSAFWSGDKKDNNLIDILHGSPRLTQWAKVAEGYRIWSADSALSVTVTTEKIYTDKGRNRVNLQDGLSAQILYNTIQTAQAIVQSNGSSENEEDYFAPGDGFTDGASLDAALEETNTKPLDEEDADLIEEVTNEKAEKSVEKSVYKSAVSYGTSSVVTELDDAELASEAANFTTKANRKNSSIDEVQCQYCGNLNRAAYKGTCPQCPKQAEVKPATRFDNRGIPIFVDEAKDETVKDCPKTENTLVIARLKSLQGRVLNVMEASFSDKTQREAVKTLINKEFRREMNRVGFGWGKDEE